MYKLNQQKQDQEKTKFQENIENIVTNGLGYKNKNRRLAFEKPAAKYFVRGLNFEKLVDDLPNTPEELQAHLYEMNFDIQKSLKTPMGVSKSGLIECRKNADESRKKQNLLSMIQTPIDATKDLSCYSRYLDRLIDNNYEAVHNFKEYGASGINTSKLGHN